MTADKKGFTLIEVLVAMAVAGIAIVAAFELFSASLRTVSASEVHVQAAMLGHEKMRDALSRDTLSGGLQWQETVQGKTTGRGGQQKYYNVSVSLTPRDLPHRRTAGPLRLYDVKLTLSWTDRGKQKSYTLHGMRLVNETKI